MSEPNWRKIADVLLFAKYDHYERTLVLIAGNQCPSPVDAARLALRSEPKETS